MHLPRPRGPLSQLVVDGLTVASPTWWGYPATGRSNPRACDPPLL